jgi:hypothetical protein
MMNANESKSFALNSNLNNSNKGNKAMKRSLSKKFAQKSTTSFPKIKNLFVNKLQFEVGDFEAFLKDFVTIFRAEMVDPMVGFHVDASLEELEAFLSGKEAEHAGDFATMINLLDTYLPSDPFHDILQANLDWEYYAHYIETANMVADKGGHYKVKHQNPESPCGYCRRVELHICHGKIHFHIYDADPAYTMVELIWDGIEEEPEEITKFVRSLDDQSRFEEGIDEKGRHYRIEKVRENA